MEQGTFDLAGEDAPAPVKLCECGCGQPTSIAVRTDRKRGRVKGQPMRFCWGHGRRRPRPSGNPRGSKPRLLAEAGQRFGRGTVIDPEVRVPDKSTAGSRRAVRLRCDCGVEYVASISSVFAGTTQSCGCLLRESARRRSPRKGRRVIDRTGQRFGALVVISLVDTAPGYARWLCRCDCGNETISGRLLNTSSCGCLRTFGGGVSDPKGGRSPGEAARLHVFRQYRNNAKRRDRAWELSDEDFDKLTSSDCFYCGAPPSREFSTGQYEGATFIYNGIDRKDNRLGYTRENTLPCCRICNIAKRDLPYDDFLAWIARLTEYHFFHPDVMPSALLRKAAG